MDTLKVNRLAEKKIKQGICLIEEKDMVTFPSEIGLFFLETQEHHYLGQAYFAPQHKGIGWFITPDKSPINDDFFRRLFVKAKQKRQFYQQVSHTNAYRIFHQDGDGFGGCTIDIYGQYAVFSWYNEWIFSIRETISQAFQAIFPEIEGGYEKIRFKGVNYESAHLYGETAPETFVIYENGVSYNVFLNDGLMTGIFLDQHEVRGQLVDGLAMGKRVLNLFSYTAAFSVAAAMGGAFSTTSVDLAKRSKELSEAHFTANGLPLHEHQFIVMDVFAYFKYAKRHGLSYDVIILDPPSFARNKKQTFSVAKDYHHLVAAATELLVPNGCIIASTNAANVSIKKFQQQVEKGLVNHSYRFLRTNRLPSDFAYNKNDESSNYLKVFTIQVEK